MKRDMSLVRHILKETERADGPLDAETLVTSEWSFETVAYHVEIMTDRGLIDGSVIRDANNTPVRGFVRSLTWEGCDFLDAVRDERVWSRTKRAVADAAGSATFDVVKATAVAIATRLIAAGAGL